MSTKPDLEHTKSTSKLNQLFGKEVKSTVPNAPPDAIATNGALGIKDREKASITGWIKKLGEADVPLLSNFSYGQKRYLKMQASWEGEGSIVKYYTDSTCSASNYRGTIRLKTVVDIVPDKESTTRFRVHTPTRTFYFETVENGPTRTQWLQMWQDNTNFTEAQKLMTALAQVAVNDENTAGITRPTPEELAKPRIKRPKKPTSTGTGPKGHPGAPAPLSRDVEDKLTGYERQIADLKAQLAKVMSGGNKPATSPRPGADAEEKTKQERLNVLLEMGFVSPEEYDEKLVSLVSPGRSGTSSKLSSPKKAKSKTPKEDSKLAKLDELLAMGVITADEYSERAAKIKK